MKIGIDARFYGEAGPGRYVSQLLKNLEVIDGENEYTIYLKKSNFNEYQPKNPKFSKKLADFPWYSFAEQLVFPFMLYKEKFDLVHFTQINVPLLYLLPFVVTIHDVILHEFSTERGGLFKRLSYRFKRIFYFCRIYPSVPRAACEAFFCSAALSFGILRAGKFPSPIRGERLRRFWKFFADSAMVSNPK